MTRTLLRRSLTIAALLASGPALAHPGLAHDHGLAAGFLHPLMGLDHVLAMVAVGLLGAVLGGRSLWLLPASFLGMMAAGAALGLAGIGLPFVETGIGASVVILGAALALRWTAPAGLAAGVSGAFAVFHGFAHGAELPVGAEATGYAAGFLVATALLHGLGLLAGLGAARLGRLVPRVAGGAISLAGFGLLAGWL